MSDKVIPGTSRTALRFVVENWQELFIVSIVPLILFICIMGLLMYRMMGMLEFFGDLDPKSPQFPAEFMSQYMHMLPWSLGLGLLLGLCMAWLYVRMTRFWKSGHASLLVSDKGEFSAAAYTLAYAIGIGILTSFAYIVVMIVAFLTGALVVGLAHLVPIFYVLLVPLFATVYFSLIWFSTRFHLAMPQVALGETPNLLPDVWNLSKGESFAVPLRVLLAMLVISIPVFAVEFAFIFPQMQALQQATQDPGNPKLAFEMFTQFWYKLLPLHIFGIVVMLLMMAYFTVFFAEANARLRGRRS